MMRTTTMTAALAALATAATLNAQAPQQPPQTPQSQPQAERQQPATDTPRAAADNPQTVTITGCLKEEKDVAGRTPNPAERAGVGEDYLLTNVKMSTSSTTSGIGLASSYQVKGVAEAELKKHIGHQVEVVGRIAGNTANRPSAGATDTPAAARSDVPDFTATSIKMLSATCPAQ